MYGMDCRLSRPAGENHMRHLLCKVWREDEGQDIAEYAVMLAVILVIVVGTVKLIGTNANTVFSQVASSIAN
jgi:Flp pilus assembly pilin Flp